MDRLTKHTGTQRYLDIDGELWSIGEANAITHSMFDRLAAYEDNNQTPEEQAAMIAQNKALQARIDEARAAIAELARRIDIYSQGDLGKRLHRIAADEPDAGDRLMQVQCGDARGRLQQTPEEPLPFTEE